jgi:hypothetical protein
VPSVDTLTEKLDALAAALREAGIPHERTAALLGTAATATMRALVLDAVLAGNAEPAVTPGVPATDEPDVGQPLRVAA